MAQKQKPPPQSKKGSTRNNKKDSPARDAKERRVERHEQAHENERNPNRKNDPHYDAANQSDTPPPVHQDPW